MNSTEVREALLGRWPASEYLTINEAPSSHDRGGSKLDVLVVSPWLSRGLSLDGVEIKVSMSDWRRELNNPAKADWWHARVHRFWIAAPADIATKIKPELPPGWGLLSVTDSSSRAAVQPEVNRSPIPLEWPEVVGLLRAAADCGPNALHREFTRGLAEGEALVRAEFERVGTSDPATVRKLRDAENDLRNLAASVEAFEDASGLKLASGFGGSTHHAKRLGEVVAVVNAAIAQGPAVLDARLNNEVTALHRIAETLEALRVALGEALAVARDEDPS